MSLDEKVPLKGGGLCFELPKTKSDFDYPVTLTGHLTSKPSLSYFGKDNHAKAKFRVLIIRNVYPIPCVAVFQQAEQIAQCEQGTNVLVGGIMRHLNGAELKPSTRYGVLQVSNLIIMPKGYSGLDLDSLFDKVRRDEERIRDLEESMLMVKDQMDSYGIKVQKKRDWRDGAEPGSLW